MVVPNGAGGSEATTRLEYDVEFAHAGTYRVWYRASGADGNDDSIWFHLNGERPFERSTGNMASMTGFGSQADFVWRNEAQEGGAPFTVEIPSPGLHTIGVALREDGAYLDKLILTTSTTFNPTGVGPAETREGAPGFPTVAVTAPTAGQSFSPGANIPITVNAAGQSELDIVRVVYTVNNAFIGESTSSPFGFTWNNVPIGIHSIRATAYDEIGQATTSDSVVATVSGGQQGARIAFISFHTADDAPAADAATAQFTEAPDKAYTDLLTAAGHQVTRYGTTSAPDVELLNAFDLVIISRSVPSGEYQATSATWNGITAPVMILGGYVLRGSRLGFFTGETIPDTEGPIRLQVNDPDHPIFDGISLDETGLMLNEYAGIVNIDFVNPATQRGISVVTSPVAGSGNVLATVGTAGDAATGGLIIGEWEAGDEIKVDAIAGISDVLGGPRLVFLTGSREANGLTSQIAGVSDLTVDGSRMFLNAVAYMSGVEPEPPGSSIAFVSFHAAEDDSPTANAAAANFTEAPDVGYTDLLRSRGHSVTRIVSSNEPDVALLNSFDLVIISRSVGSGNYDTAEKTLTWNGITAPMMILGGYIIRNNRLGFATGDNIPDTEGPVTLAVAQPSHPIFSGVTLDASGVMVNPFADAVTLDFIEEPPPQLQRGISVVTDPMRGGTVLATVAGEGSGAGGMIIGEWPAGAAVSSRGDILGGPRLIFLTGSRESMDLTSEGAGVFDLTSDGTTMFINAVEYLLDPDVPPPGPTVSAVRTAGGISIEFTGTLEGAPEVDGPWTDVSSTSPHEAATDQPMRFYRARQ